MAQGDGSVLITVDLNAKEAEQELSRLKKGILRMEEDLLLSKTQESNLEKMLKNARDRVEELKASGSPTPWLEEIPNLEKQIAVWEKELSGVRTEIETTANDIESTKILYAELELATAQVRAEEEARVAAAAKAREEAKAAAEQAKEQARIAREQAREEAKAAAIREAERAKAAKEFENAAARAVAEKASPEVVQLNEELRQLQATLRDLEDKGIGLGYAEYDDATKRVAEINDQLREYKKNLTDSNKELEKMPENVEEVAEGARQLSPAMQAASGRLEKFENRIVGLAKRVFVFSLITSALRSMRTWLGNAVKSNDQAAAAIARLKGALLTMAQPILQVVIPAFITLVNVLTRVVTAIASLFATLSGKTLQQSADAAKSLYDEQNAISGVGSAAKKASKQLASFDEINKLSAEDAGGGGGAAGAAPTFDFGEVDTSMLDQILKVVEAIGAAFAAWKIGKALGMEFGEIAFLALGIYESIQFITDIFNMWQNGISFDNLKKAVFDLAVAAVALGIALGPAAAGITLIVGGLALFVTGVRDAMKNGMNWANTLTMIAGLLAAGIGIGVMTDHWFPLYIAAVAGALLALVMFTGHGEELMAGLRNIFDGFITFITGVFAGDWEQAFAGLEQMGEGFKQVWQTIVQAVQDAWASFVTWFDEKTNGQFHFIIETIENYFSGMFEAVKTILSGIIDFVAGVFTGDLGRALKGVLNVFVGIINGIITAFEGMVNLVISGINTLTRGINNALTITIPDFVPGVGGKSWSPNIPAIGTVTLQRVPALAAGAVIPPNREFLAVLGDQKSGTNIEAPLDTIVAAFRQVMNEQGNGGGKQTIVLQLDRRELGRAVVDVYNLESQRVGVEI